jgi:pantoate--beta-alanine ligase
VNASDNSLTGGRFPVQIIRDIITLRTAISSLRDNGATIALVPTMGALHEGHMALVDEAHRHASHVVTSIFVNPKQFGPNEDLDAYPRREEKDATLLREHKTAILWAPTVEEMYPAGFASNISVTGVSDGLCGAARPGHFDGVATVVCKLLNQVRPDIALFGEKDYQQLAVIRRMVRDLDLPFMIAGIPTQRAQDGLALSSRNAYMTEQERTAAVALPRALGDAARRITAGEDCATILTQSIQALLSHGFASVDYFELCDADTLQPLSQWDRPARLLAAARMGKTRLIDNIAVN